MLIGAIRLDDNLLISELLGIIVSAITGIATLLAVIITLCNLSKAKRSKIKTLSKKNVIEPGHEIEIINNDTKNIILKQLGVKVKSQWVAINKVIYNGQCVNLPLEIEPNQYIAIDSIVGLIIDAVSRRTSIIPKQLYSIDLYYGVNQKKRIGRVFCRREVGRFNTRHRIRAAWVIQETKNLDENKVIVFHRNENITYVWKIPKCKIEEIFHKCKRSLTLFTQSQYFIVGRGGRQAVFLPTSNECIKEINQMLQKNCEMSKYLKIQRMFGIEFETDSSKDVYS